MGDGSWGARQHGAEARAGTGEASPEKATRPLFEGDVFPVPQLLHHTPDSLRGRQDFVTTKAARGGGGRCAQQVLLLTYPIPSPSFPP